MDESLSCFSDPGNLLANVTWSPCGATNESVPVVSCCTQGSVCYNNNLCGTLSPGPDLSNWYIAGCTDPNYGSECSSLCPDLLNDGVVFNYTNKMWQCCGFEEGNDEYENCLGATFEQQFSAPAPADLVPYFTVPVSDSDTSTLPSTVAHPSSTLRSTQSYATRQTSTPTPTTTPPNPNLRASPTRLSTAASVGIGIGTTIAVTMAICAGIFMVYTCRKKRHRYTPKSELKNRLHANTLQEDQYRPAPIELDPENYVCEMAPGRYPPQEMMAEFSAQELPA